MNTPPNLISMLTALVAVPSVSSASPRLDMGNRAVIDLLAAWLELLNFKTEIIPLAANPQKANLLATRGSGPGGLVLAGHTDTVPFDEGLWLSNPLVVTERDNKLYGLGSTDMKGFFPIVIEAIKKFGDLQFQQPLIVLATADEESSMNGARELVQLGRPKARYAVIGEPTGLKPIRMHKGVMMESIHVLGRAGHSSDPSLGNNALEAMHQVIAELLLFRQTLQEKFTHNGFAVNIPTLNLGCIHGGDNPNRICGQCELQFDLRLLPGMDNGAMRGDITKILNTVAIKTNTTIQLAPLFQGVNPYAEAADSAIVSAAEKLTGYQSGAVSFATEAPFLQQLGIETVILGPGSIDQAHQPNEYMPMDQIDPAIAIIESLIRQFCLA